MNIDTTNYEWFKGKKPHRHGYYSIEVNFKNRERLTYNVCGDFEEWIEEIKNRHLTDIITEIIVGV